MIYWVVEKGDVECPRYLTVVLDQLEWSTPCRIETALRFSRKIDADAIAPLIEGAERSQSYYEESASIRASKGTPLPYPADF